VAADLPGTVRVKLSSEEAGAVSLTAVVLREMPTRALIGLMLDYTGKDTRRIQDLLLRGTLVSGATRYRWQGWQASVESIEALLASFPNAEPARPFAPQRCVHVLLRGPGMRTEVSREALARRSLFNRGSFWDVLLEVASEAGLEYDGYSYREQADRYRLAIPQAGLERLRESARLVRFSALEAQIRTGSVRVVEFFVRRPD
jgi:hypothetical protein